MSTEPTEPAVVKAQGVAVIAVVSGALLVISLLLNWWGLPEDLLDPPADAPGAVKFMAEAYADSGQTVAADGFEFFELRDLVWLVTGIVAFLFGLAVLLGLPAARMLGAAAGALGLVSLVTIATALISPPDLLELNERLGALPLGLDFDLPASRKIGGWLALFASLGIVGSTLLVARDWRHAAVR